MKWLLYRLGKWLVHRCAQDQFGTRIHLMLALAGESMIVVNAHFVLPKGTGPKPVYPDAGGGMVVGNIFETHECAETEGEPQ